MNKLLISGCSSGFGRYLREELGGSRFDRLGFPPNPASVDVIIHAAFGGSLEYPDEYIKKAKFYAEKLHKEVYHKKFIFISSIDVYPKDKKMHTEDEKICSNDVQGVYGLTKRIIEQQIQHFCPNYLILRCGALLGKYTPLNNIRKTVANGGNTINISHKSTFNLIRYEQVLEFIKEAINNDWTGIYNIVASNNIKFKDLCRKKNKGYKYITPPLSYQKFLQKTPSLINTSHENYLTWLKNEY